MHSYIITNVSVDKATHELIEDTDRERRWVDGGKRGGMTRPHREEAYSNYNGTLDNASNTGT